jgi:hypothetical protein
MTSRLRTVCPTAPLAGFAMGAVAVIVAPDIEDHAHSAAIGSAQRRSPKGIV